MDDLGSTSVELKAIEECTEDSIDIEHEQTAKQDVDEKIEGIVEKNSEEPAQLLNKACSDHNIDCNTSLCEVKEQLPKRKVSLRKKSRVEFRAKPNLPKDERELNPDSSSRSSNIGRRSSTQARHTRQSFSGKAK